MSVPTHANSIEDARRIHRQVYDIIQTLYPEFKPYVYIEEGKMHYKGKPGDPQYDKLRGVLSAAIQLVRNQPNE